MNIKINKMYNNKTRQRIKQRKISKKWRIMTTKMFSDPPVNQGNVEGINKSRLGTEFLRKRMGQRIH